MNYSDLDDMEATMNLDASSKSPDLSRGLIQIEIECLKGL